MEMHDRSRQGGRHTLDPIALLRVVDCLVVQTSIEAIGKVLVN